MRRVLKPIAFGILIFLPVPFGNSFYEQLGLFAFVVGIAYYNLVIYVYLLTERRYKQKTLNQLAKDAAEGKAQGPFAVYLRPFKERFYVSTEGTDAYSTSLFIGSSSTKIFNSSTNNILELESYLAQTFYKVWSVVGLGHPHRGYFSFGPGFIRVKDDEWKELVTALLEGCEAIFVVPSNREGTLWELTQLSENPHWLKKMVFFMPHFDAQLFNSIQRSAGIARVFRRLQDVDLTKSLRGAKSLQSMLDEASRYAFWNWLALRAAKNRSALLRRKLKKKWETARRAAQKLGFSFPKYSDDGKLFLMKPNGKALEIGTMGNLRDKQFRTLIEKRLKKLKERDDWPEEEVPEINVAD